MIDTTTLTTTVGAEVAGVDVDRLLHDPAVPEDILAALEEHGVLLFRAIGVDDDAQVAFGGRLGDVVMRGGAGVTVITQDPGHPVADYLRGNLRWHMDGALSGIPEQAGILSAREIAAGDGGTEFASTYAAYDELSDDEKEEFATLRVIHTMEAVLRGVTPDPTTEQLTAWRQRPPSEHPLVWTHRSGRKSLVIGATADHVVGMDVDEGRAFLGDLLERATAPGRVFRHDWTVGDMAIWDNRGLVHRVTDYDSTSRRELHRVTLAGDEAIQ